jgi:hypothetical protein
MIILAVSISNLFSTVNTTCFRQAGRQARRSMKHLRSLDMYPVEGYTLLATYYYDYMIN